MMDRVLHTVPGTQPTLGDRTMEESPWWSLLSWELKDEKHLGHGASESLSPLALWQEKLRLRELK